MGKAKKIKVSKSSMAKVALADQIEDDSTAKIKNRQKHKVRKDGDDEVRNKHLISIYLFSYYT